MINVVCGIFVFLIIILAIYLLIARWLYRDAENRTGNGVLWLILYLVLTPFIALIWLFVRPSNNKERIDKEN